MGGWLLILTLAASYPSNGYAIAQVGPFYSREQCAEAASAWQRSIQTGGSRSAICVDARPQ